VFVARCIAQKLQFTMKENIMDENTLGVIGPFGVRRLTAAFAIDRLGEII
jgi:hypothetical protein